MKAPLRLLSAALVVALAPLARAQTTGQFDAQVGTLDATAANRGQSQVAARIAASFESLAGSQDNSLALVNALRNGAPVTLTAPANDSGTTTGSGAGTTTDPGTGTTTGTGTGTTTGTGGTTGTGTGTIGTGTGATGSTGDTTITPPTGKMGWGEVFISLALAKGELANLGITDPTASQLQAALTGGDITNADGKTITVKGVLEMRADGMGWGRIAQAEGAKLGPLVSSIKSARVHVASLAPSAPPTAPLAGGGTKSLVTVAGAAKATSHGRGIVTASGSSPGAPIHGHKGVVTASGSSSGAFGGKGSKGIVSASGLPVVSASAHGMRGITTASGGVASSSRGLVTAEGATGGVHGHAYGRGVVTAAGGAAAVVASNAAATSVSAGVVTATGAAAASSSGVTNAAGHGNAGGSGHGRGHQGGG